MGRKNTLDKSLESIEKYFDSTDVKSFTEYKFSQIFHDNRRNWKVSEHSSPTKLIEYLVKKEMLHENIIVDNENFKKIIYSWKSIDELTIIRGIKHNSYFAYYTSIYLHNLTLQIPRTVYLNIERSRPVELLEGTNKKLEQNSIDNAFSKSQRKSSNQYTFKDKKIIITNGKYTDRLGVVRTKTKEKDYYFTNLERTLIDIAVRPVYAGGVFEVKEAYLKAKGIINLKLLKNYLSKLNYTYPYQQVIGFYLDKCGYSLKESDLFNFDIEYDFYLTYNIRNKEYSPKWKIYYPKQF